jgi:hypothetical protein
MIVSITMRGSNASKACAKFLDGMWLRIPQSVPAHVF